MAISDLRILNRTIAAPLGNSLGTPVPKVIYWNRYARTTLGALGGDVNRAARSNYYDDLLEENTQRAMKRLPPTEEYKRLDYLTNKLMTQIDEGTLDEEGVSIEVEVLEFLGAFERLLGPQLLGSELN
jgi:hypothetical protein